MATDLSESEFLAQVTRPGFGRADFIKMVASLMASALRPLPTSLRDEVAAMAKQLLAAPPLPMERAVEAAAPHDSVQTAKTCNAAVATLGVKG